MTMKNILIFAALCIGMVGYGQKIDSCRYNKVDTVIVYQDAQVLIYKNKSGKVVKDTLMFELFKCDVKIKEAGEMIINSSQSIPCNAVFKKCSHPVASKTLAYCEPPQKDCNTCQCIRCGERWPCY